MSQLSPSLNDSSSRYDRHQLSVQDKYQVVCLIWRLYDAEKDQHDVDGYSKVANYMGVSPLTVESIWNEYCEQIQDGMKVPDLTPKNHGHPCSQLTVVTDAAIRRINDQKEGYSDYREMSFLLDIPLSTSHRYLNVMGAHKLTSHIKPLLTLRHKLNRILYVLYFNHLNRLKLMLMMQL
jgi:hypothetical protein